MHHLVCLVGELKDRVHAKMQAKALQDGAEGVGFANKTGVDLAIEHRQISMQIDGGFQVC